MEFCKLPVRQALCLRCQSILKLSTTPVYSSNNHKRLLASRQGSIVVCTSCGEPGILTGGFLKPPELLEWNHMFEDITFWSKLMFLASEIKSRKLEERRYKERGQKVDGKAK